MVERSVGVGDTDYTGAQLLDIHRHCEEWRSETRETIKNLQKLHQEAKDNFSESDNLQVIQDYLSHFIDLFSRYQYDFGRLISGMKRQVKDVHVEIVSQLYRSCEVEEDRCIRFKSRHIEHVLLDESMRPLLDEIYVVTRDLILSLKDLSNLEPRLRTFIGEGLQRRGSSSRADSARREILKVVQRELDKGTHRKEPFYVVVLRALDQAGDIVQKDRLLRKWQEENPSIKCWMDVKKYLEYRLRFQVWLHKVAEKLKK